MSAMIPFAAGAVPAHIAAFFAPEESNIKATTRVPQLHFKGKVWAIEMNGEKNQLLDREGNPLPSLDLIVVDQNPNRSRTYYEGTFVEGENKAPSCASINGLTPDKNIASPQCQLCAQCPQAVKGSKINDAGQPTVACVTTKRLAVVPAKAPGSDMLLLRLPQTSIYDKTNPQEAQGKFAWDQLMRFIQANNATHTAQVVIRVSFDINAAYPKILFSVVRWTTPDELQLIKPRLGSPELKDIIAGSEAEGDGEAPAPAAAPQVTIPVRQVPSPTPAPAPEPAPEPAATGAAIMFGGDDDDTAAPAATPTPTPTAAKTTKAAAKPAAETRKAAPTQTQVVQDSGLGALIEGWGS